MTINFEDECCSIMCDNGIIIEIDRENAIDMALQILNFYEDSDIDDE